MKIGIKERVTILENQIKEIAKKYSIELEDYNNPAKVDCVKAVKDLSKSLEKLCQNKPTKDQLEAIPGNEMWRYEGTSTESYFRFGSPFIENKTFSTYSGYGFGRTFTHYKDILSARPATKEERQEVYKKDRRMMPLHDFSDAWVGMDKVDYTAKGEGVVINIDSSSDYPILVDFPEYGHITFTIDGKRYLSDKNATLATRPIKIVEA